jgi:hypothetical protein
MRNFRDGKDFCKAAARRCHVGRADFFWLMTAAQKAPAPWLMTAAPKNYQDAKGRTPFAAPTIVRDDSTQGSKSGTRPDLAPTAAEVRKKTTRHPRPGL